ncbi:MAG: extracellular solute-binding protein, partial [Pseudomonadota bacterium]
MRRSVNSIGFASRCGLTTLVCVLFTSVAWAEGGKVAFVVGNASYAHLPALANPANDASAISEKLASIGYDVDTVIDGDLPTIRARLDSFAVRASGAEQALIFFAGHGLQVQGQNYLLPVDLRLERQEQLQSSALGVQELFNAFNKARPDAAILILDACRDNPFTGGSGVNQGLTSGNAGAISPRPNAAGIVIAFAAAPGAVAYDGVDGNSPYTTALLKWLDRPGLEIATMLRRVRETVVQLTNGNQIPWVEEALVRDVFLTDPEPEPAAPDATIEVALLDQIESLSSTDEKQAAQTFYDRYLVDASAEARALPDQSRDEDEQLVREGLIWLGIRRSDNPDHFRQFLDQFPNGSFAEQAKVRLDELNVIVSQPPEALDWMADLEPIQVGAPSSGTLTITGFNEENPVRPGAPGGLVDTQAQTTDQRPNVNVGGPSLSPSEAELDLALDKGELAAIQVLLRFAGYYNGAIDASYGPGTRGAIKDFQRDRDLLATGYLTQRDLRELVGRVARAVLESDPEAAIEANIHNVAAIAARGPGAEPTVIRVASLDYKPEVNAYIRDVADDFQAERPGTLVEFNRRSGPEYNAQLMAILGSETPPDVLYTWGGGHLRALRDAGFARNLTPEMRDDWAFQFKPGALQNYTLNGGVYGAPRHLSIASLYVNKGILEDAGIPLSQLETWGGFLDAVEQLKSAGVTPLST